MRKIQIPGSQVGAVSLTATIVSAIIATLRQDWSWFAHQPAELSIAVGGILTYVLGYLSGWLKLVLTPGQQLMTRLTSTPLPTVQSAPVARGESPAA